MNINNMIDFEEIAQEAGLYDIHEGFNVDDDKCEIRCGNDGIEILITMIITNGCQVNDPAWTGTYLEIILDEGFNVITEDYEQL